MKVFKFGGASVKDAEAVKNMASIVQRFAGEDLMIIVSAMGKTTNALENVVNAYWEDKDEASTHVSKLKDYHLTVMRQLFADGHEIFQKIEGEFQEIIDNISSPKSDNYDYEYDQIVSKGEIISTLIVNAYLQTQNINSTWTDATRLIRTDNKYRDGGVNWEVTETLINKHIKSLFKGKGQVVICQGFIGHTDTLMTTTLGREGSDYSAAIFAYCLNAESVTIWKDVPGLLNADPKHFKNTVKLDKISFREAIELSYYGATVIHPKTIKPLQNKGISLYVKSFVNPEAEGSVVQASDEFDNNIPSYIFKTDQVLMSISPRDFSFVGEENLARIFAVFSKYGVKINLMQNSAINFSVSFDKTNKLEKIIEELSQEFRVLYNEGLQLMTVRHHQPKIVEELSQGKIILLKQETRETLRMLME
ncbi:MAG: aspartate kinase [Bacteroidia bacterium]